MNAPFDTLVVDVTNERLRGSQAFDYLEELDGVPARAIVLQLHNVHDDVLPRVAAFMKYLGTRRSVAVCGIRAGQATVLKSLGIEPSDVLIGKWPRTLPS